VLTNRSTKPKYIGIPKCNKVVSIGFGDIDDKDAQVCMIGKSSTSTLLASNFKKPGSFKRVFMTIRSLTII